MTRKYRHISDYEKEIIKMYEEGLSLRRIGERLGFNISTFKFRECRCNN